MGCYPTKHMERDVAILMADLTGYTAMTDIHGGASAAKMVDKYLLLVDKACCGQCKPVQRIGDQVVMISEKAIDVAMTAQCLNILTLEEHDFLAVHSGIHFGSIFEKNGNYFGSTINIASRIMNLAKRGQVLCSDAFVNKIGIQSAFEVKPLGKAKLKNVSKEIEIYELFSPSKVTSSFPIDPVCHMHVDPTKCDISLQYEGEHYYFCSQQCLNLFMERIASN